VTLKNRLQKKAKNERNKLEITQDVVRIPEPQGPKKRPPNPPRKAPIRGRKTIFKYIF